MVCGVIDWREDERWRHEQVVEARSVLIACLLLVVVGLRVDRDRVSHKVHGVETDTELADEVHISSL